MVMAMARFFSVLCFCLLGISVVGLQFAAAQNLVSRPARFATEYDWSSKPRRTSVSQAVRP